MHTSFLPSLDTTTALPDAFVSRSPCLSFVFGWPPCTTSPWRRLVSPFSGAFVLMDSCTWDKSMSVWWFLLAPLCLLECFACRMACTSPVPCSSSNPDGSSACLVCSSLMNKRFSYTASPRRRLLSPSLWHRLDPLDIGVLLSSDDCVWIKGMAICGPLETSIRVLGRVGCLVIGT
jgi:hypothetical protein